MWIKICGIRDIATVRDVAALSPSAVGLNFFDRTPRTVSVAVAAEIVGILPDGVEPVGLFVNHSQAEIEDCCRRCRLRTIQLHGDEPPQLLAELRGASPGVKIIRAVRVGREGFGTLADELEACRDAGALPDACLVDARVEGVYGGTGQTVSWKQLSDEYRRDEWPPLILGGGLTPHNVAEAIRIVRPWGVDVASGVESATGTKDVRLVRMFIESARDAFDDTEGH